MYTYEFHFLGALALTLLIEVSVLLIISHIVFKNLRKEYTLFQIIFWGCLASLLTLPYLWFILPVFIHSYLAQNIIGEISVTCIEALLYKIAFNISFGEALVISIACNRVSWLTGRIIL